MAGEDLSKLKIDKSSASARPRRFKKSVYIGAVALIGLFIGFLYVQGFISPATTVEITTVSQIYPSQGFTLLNASGYVVAQRKAAVASKATGRLVALMVEEGSHVRKGQIIARIENDDVLASQAQAQANVTGARANLEQAKAEMEDADTTHRRDKRLLAGGYIAQSQYDASETRYRRAAAGVASAEAAIKAAAASRQGADVALEYTLIRAPFDAVVLTKNADIGDLVTPLGSAANAKAAVVSIADLDSLRVEVDVSETNIHLVKNEQPCEIQLDAVPDSRFRGLVHAIVPTVDRSKASILVKVRFVDKDSRMLPDMSAKVSFLSRQVSPQEQTPRIAVQQSALINRAGQAVAFLVQSQQVVEKAVQAGEKLGDMVEVISGLKPGDKVVMKPASTLKDGTRVKIAEK